MSSSDLTAAVVRPTEPDEIAAAIGQATRVAIRGAGTKADWGGPVTDVDLVVDLSGLDRVLDHEAGDLVARVQAGVRLADLARTLAPAGQRLALDEVVPGSTVGGVLATGLAGPLRAAHGGVRDLVLGVTVVLGDGRTTKAGGRVVKNVAGYDLCKLHTGAYGTLGILTEAWLRLHPLPARRVWVEVTDLADADHLAPAAVEVHARPGESPQLVALLEGTEAGVAARLKARDEMDEPAWWATLPGLGPDETLLKLTTVREGSDKLVKEAARHEGVTLTGSAATGVLWAGIEAGTATDEAAATVSGLRAACTETGGFATVLRAPDDVRDAVDVWGPVPGLELMRRVKDELDPDHRLAPGRFVGGI